MKNGLLSVLILAALGCSNRAHQKGAATGLASTADQTSSDVQILQAWTDKTLTLDHTKCVGPDPQDQQRTVKDCSAHASQLTRAPWADRDSPAVNNWQLPVTKYQGQVYSPNNVGNMVEIRVVAKRSAVDAPTFAGIGFFYRNTLASETRLISKNDLHIVSQQDVTLKATNEPGVVYRFVLSMPGTQGNSGTGWSMESVSFKPFAKFDTPDGNSFQNWDPRSENYTVYRAANGGGRVQVNSIDRQDELLKR